MCEFRPHSDKPRFSGLDFEVHESFRVRLAPAISEVAIAAGFLPAYLRFRVVLG
jgi:hypothetical protein